MLPNANHLVTAMHLFPLQSPSHKTGKHGIVAASATNHQPNLAFPVIFIEYTVYITNLLIISTIYCISIVNRTFYFCYILIMFVLSAGPKTIKIGRAHV